jgi:hypothetical protein
MAGNNLSYDPVDLALVSNFASIYRSKCRLNAAPEKVMEATGNAQRHGIAQNAVRVPLSYCLATTAVVLRKGDQRTADCRGRGRAIVHHMIGLFVKTSNGFCIDRHIALSPSAP